MEEPAKHFAIKYHIAKELAQNLKAKGITKVMPFKDDKMALRLQFYDISRGGGYVFYTQKEVDGGYEMIPISYYGVVKSKHFICILLAKKRIK